MFAIAAGCEDKHIGRPCDVGVDPATLASSEEAIITSPALECPSRVCLLSNAGQDSTGDGALCTSACSSDDDCADAESTRCKQGFACGWPTTVGPFCCQKMCLCRDLAPEPAGGFPEPEACKSPKGGCQNVH